MARQEGHTSSFLTASVFSEKTRAGWGLRTEEVTQKKRTEKEWSKE